MTELGQDHKSLFYCTTFYLPENRYKMCKLRGQHIFLSSSSTRRWIIIGSANHHNSYSCFPSLPGTYFWRNEELRSVFCLFFYFAFLMKVTAIAHTSLILFTSSFFPVLNMVMMARSTLIVLQPGGMAKRISHWPWCHWATQPVAIILHPYFPYLLCEKELCLSYYNQVF